MNAEELWNTRHALRVLAELEQDGGVQWVPKPAKRVAPTATTQQAGPANAGTEGATPSPSHEVAPPAEAHLPAQCQFIFLTDDTDNPLLDQPPLGDLFGNILKAMKLSYEDIGVVPLPQANSTAVIPWLEKRLEAHQAAVLIPLGPSALRAVHTDPAISLLHQQGRPFALAQHTCVATWDIAYLQRNPEAKKEAWKALQVALAEAT